jgi:hypothetical protein
MILASNGILASSISDVNADYVAFYNRVIAAGGSLNATEQSATMQLILDLKSYGIWTSMKAIYPMVGASAAACAQNLKSPSFTGSFTSGWTFASTGATPNGSSAYMETNFNSSTDIGTNTGCLGYYSRTNNGPQNMVEMGALATNYFFMHVCLSNTFYIMPNTQAVVGYIAVANTNSSGFYQGYRTSSTEIGGRRNSTSYSGTIAYAGVNLSVWLGARHIASGGEFYTNRECAFAYLGNTLTDTQAGNYYTAVQAFQTTLSRQV